MKDIYQNLFKKASKNKDKGEEKENNEKDKKADEKFRIAACGKWLDVRAFGQVFAFGKESSKDETKDVNNDASKDKDADTDKKEKGAGVSIGIRGPVSVHPAFSVAQVTRKDLQSHF